MYFPNPFLLDLDRKRHEIKNICEGNSLKQTAVLGESHCSHTTICKYGTADVIDVGPQWKVQCSKHGLLKVQLRYVILCVCM